MTSLYITIMAGGNGKRMNSDKPKVLQLVKGKPMIVRILEQIILFNPTKILIVVGCYKFQIETEIKKYINYNNIEYINQEQQLGTGHAVMCTLNFLKNNLNGVNIILNGDTPFIKYQTIRNIYDYYINNNQDVLITAVQTQNPTGCGRIIKINDLFEEIVEERDCTYDQKKIQLINCGVYICTTNILYVTIPKIEKSNSQSEYYLTDFVKISKKIGLSVGLFVCSDNQEYEFMNINTVEQLNIANSI